MHAFGRGALVAVDSGWIDLGGGSPYWKAPVASAVLLPAQGNDLGDARVAQDTSTIYIWNGSSWASEAPGSGTVTSVGLSLPNSLFSVSNSPVTGSGTLTGTLSLQAANTTFSGPSSGGNAQPTFRALVIADIPALPYQAVGNYITALTGDGSASGPGSAVLTLATVNTAPGSFGGVSQSLNASVNAKGLITALSANSIQIAEGQVTNLVSDLAAKQATGNYLTALTGDVTAAGPGSAVATLATVNSMPGTFGSATNTPVVTVNVKGLVPTLSSTPIQIAESQVTNLVSDLASKQATGNYVTSLTGDITGSGPGATATTLATVNATPGTFTYASITVNAKGLITAASNSTSPTSGTVTSVALTAPSIFTVSGSPITSSGTLAIGLATEAANLVWAGPASGAATTPTFRALVVADIPALPYQAPGNYITALTGDAAASGPGSAAITLATVNSSPGTFGSASASAVVTVNAKGLSTTVTATAIQITESQVTNLVSDLAGKQSIGNYLTALTGDGTATGPGSAVLTLAAVNATVGSFGSASQVPVVTVNGKGLVTNAVNTSIQVVESQVTNLVSDLAGKQPTGAYITTLTGDVSATGPGSSATTLATVNSTPGTYSYASVTVNAKGLVTAATSNAAPTGTVTSVSVVSANGLAGTVATATTTPAITLSTTVTGIAYANGTGFVAAVASNFPTLNQNTTGTASNITATSNSTLTTLSALALPYSQLIGTIPTWNQNTTGTAANITATSNSTLTTLPSLSLPYSQITGAPAAITALTGDGTATGPGSAALTLATVNTTTGSFGTASNTGTFTVNGKGLVTASSNTPIQIAESQVTNLVSDLAGKQPTGNYITGLTGDVTAAGPGSAATTLATVNTTPGTYTYSTVTVNAKGLVTSATSGAAPTGTVTSVALTDGTGLFNVTGSPVTTAGTLSLATLKLQIANGVFAGPASGASATPSFRALVVADIPALPYQAPGNYITALTGDATASGPGSAAITLATVATAGTSPKVTYNAKGLVTSGTALASADIPNNAANTTGTAANITATSNSTLTSLPNLSLPLAQTTGILPIANGGTDLGTAPADGKLLIGNGTGYTLNNITAGYGTVITNGVGTITDAVALTGTETSATATITTTSTTAILMTGMTVTPTPGTYLVIFSAVLGCNIAGATIAAGLYNNGVQIAQSVRQMQPFCGGTLTFGSASAGCTTTAIVTVTTGAITVEWAITNGTATAAQRTLDIVRLA